MSDALLVAKNVRKTYQRGERKIEVLRGLDLEIFAGEAICIVGASGAGKSTFMHILGGLDMPTEGTVRFEGQELFQKTDEELAKFRNQSMGFVFQFHHLLAEFSALENVMLPARIGGLGDREARRRGEELLEMLGLRERMTHFPTELSGGEQQRVAVARALIQRPRVLFADEPTGNLDTDNSRQIQELFFEFKRRFGLTLVVVTHDTYFASRFPRRLQMRDGQWN